MIENLEHVPGWVEAAPLVLGLLGIGLAYVMYIVNPLLPVRLAQSFGGIYRFLLNKWYFDELYDIIFVQPADPPGAAVLAGRRRHHHRRRAQRAGGTDQRRVAPGGQNPDRLSGRLCVRHADRRRRAGRHLHAEPVRS